MPKNSTNQLSTVVPVKGLSLYAYSPQDSLAALSEIPTGGTALLLPANSNGGDDYQFADTDGSCSPSSPITLTAPTGNTIRGASSFAVTSPFAGGALVFDETSRSWSLVGLSASAALGTVTLAGPDVTGSGPASAVPTNIIAPAFGAVQVFAADSTVNVARARVQTLLFAGSGNTANFPGAPVDGDIILIRMAFGPAGNAVTLNAGGSTSIENPQTPSAIGSTVAIVEAPGSYTYQFCAKEDIWYLVEQSALLANFSGPATPPANGAWARTIWHVNPLTGNDDNDGLTAETAVQHKAELARRFGTWTPLLNGIAVTISYDAPDTNANDPSCFTPIFLNGATLLEMAPLPTAGFTGTLNVVTPKSRSGNQILQSTFNTTSGALAPQMLLINATRANSRATVQRNVSGGTWQLSQPVGAPSASGAPSFTEVDTWASGDAITGYVLTNVNVAVAGGIESDTLIDYSHTYFQINVWDPIAGNDREDPLYVSGALFSDCAFSRSPLAGAAGGGSFSVFFNCSFAGQFFQITSGSCQIYAGAFLSPSQLSQSGGTFAGLGFDVILGGGLASYLVGAFIDEEDVAVDTNSRLTLYGASLFVNSIIYGPSTNTFDVEGILIVELGADGVTTYTIAFPIAGGLSIGGKTTAYSMATSGGVTTIHGGIALTPANLDAASGPAGFGGSASNLAGMGISNGTQN